MSDENRSAVTPDDVITQDDLREARIIENVGLPSWRKVFYGFLQGATVEAGELKLGLPWVPGQPLIVESNQEIDVESRIKNAIARHEECLAALRAQQKGLAHPHTKHRLQDLLHHFRPTLAPLERFLT